MNSRRARRSHRLRDHKQRLRVRTLIEQAIHELAPALAHAKIPVPRINWGWCEDVASLLQEKLDQRGIPNLILADDDDLRHCDHEIMTDDGWSHCWVFAHGYHFDSEARMGVRRWLHLPHFGRWAKPCELTTAAVVTPVYGQGDELEILTRNARWRLDEVKAGEDTTPWLPKWLVESELEIDFDNCDLDQWRGPL